MSHEPLYRLGRKIGASVIVSGHFHKWHSSFQRGIMMIRAACLNGDPHYEKLDIGYMVVDIVDGDVSSVTGYELQGTQFAKVHEYLYGKVGGMEPWRPRDRRPHKEDLVARTREEVHILRRMLGVFHRKSRM